MYVLWTHPSSLSINVIKVCKVVLLLHFVPICTVLTLFLCLCHPQIWFAFVNGFSGQILFERWCIGLYNVVSVSKINSLKSSLSLSVFGARLGCDGAPDLIPFLLTITNILKTFSFIYDLLSIRYSLCVPNYVLNLKEQRLACPTLCMHSRNSYVFKNNMKRRRESHRAVNQSANLNCFTQSTQFGKQKNVMTEV